MADSFDLNNRPRAADAVPQIPTSASEVAVRTLASDLEAMGQSGGFVGQSSAPAVQVPVTLQSVQAVPDAATQGGAAAQSAGNAAPATGGTPVLKIVIITAIAILAAAGLFFVGFYLI